MRGFGYDIVHLADVPERIIVPASHFGAEFTAVLCPVVSLCGVRIKSVQAVLVRMPDDTTKHRCHPCDHAANGHPQSPRRP